jgi:hypothetical protein
MIRLFGVLMFVCCIGITLFADDVSNSDTVSPQKLVPDIPDASETVQPAKGINPELLELIQKIAQDGYRLNIPDHSNNKVIDISSGAGYLKLDDVLSALAPFEGDEEPK